MDRKLIVIENTLEEAFFELKNLFFNDGILNIYLREKKYIAYILNFLIKNQDTLLVGYYLCQLYFSLKKDDINNKNIIMDILIENENYIYNLYELCKQINNIEIIDKYLKIGFEKNNAQAIYTYGHKYTELSFKEKNKKEKIILINKAIYYFELYIERKEIRTIELAEIICSLLLIDYEYIYHENELKYILNQKEKYLKYLTIAANESILSSKKLANLYLNGNLDYGIEMDQIKALEYYNKTIDISIKNNCHTEIYFELFKYYKNSINIDYIKAYEYCEKAINISNEYNYNCHEEYFEFAKLYQYGHGIKQDLLKALYYYRCAIQQSEQFLGINIDCYIKCYNNLLNECCNMLIYNFEKN
jgi:TPR repeat protein